LGCQLDVNTKGQTVVEGRGATEVDFAFFLDVDVGEAFTALFVEKAVAY
jgi:(p)ppGpp synthase/HD superfamily hydrolase